MYDALETREAKLGTGNRPLSDKTRKEKPRGLFLPTLTNTVKAVPVARREDRRGTCAFQHPCVSVYGAAAERTEVSLRHARTTDNAERTDARTSLPRPHRSISSHTISPHTSYQWHTDTRHAPACPTLPPAPLSPLRLRRCSIYYPLGPRCAQRKGAGCERGAPSSYQRVGAGEVTRR